MTIDPASFIPPGYTLLLALVLFAIGVVGVLVRRNPIVIFMSIELMLNAVNLAFLAFGHQLMVLSGQIYAFFVLAVAAAEVAIGLAIIMAIFRRREEVDVDRVNLLRW